MKTRIGKIKKKYISSFNLTSKFAILILKFAIAIFL